MSKELTFWEHFDALRRMLFRSAIAVVVLMVFFFLQKTWLFDTLIFGPRSSDFILYRWICSLGTLFDFPEICIEPFMIDIININVAAQFFTHVNMSFWLGVVAAFPYILWELWRFIAPALYPKERKGVKVAFCFSSLLFYIGLAIGYLLLFPVSLHFLGTYQVSESIANQISLHSYTGLFVTLIFTMGLVFEMPMLAYLLSRLGIVTQKFLRKYRKHAILAIFILAAIVTPSDVFTMFIVAIPLCILYEISILICKKKTTNE